MIKNIAVFGVSGVGKSTLIKSFILNEPSWGHIQAGELIKSELKNTAHDKLRAVSSEVLIKNQFLIVDAFWREIDDKKLSKIIFDGHSIIDTGAETIKVPTDIIKALKPTKLVFIKADPKIILDRRLKDTSRDRPILSIQKINEQQDMALEQFKLYAKELKLPNLILKNEFITEFSKFCFN